MGEATLACSDHEDDNEAALADEDYREAGNSLNGLDEGLGPKRELPSIDQIQVCSLLSAFFWKIYTYLERESVVNDSICG